MSVSGNGRLIWRRALEFLTSLLHRHRETRDRRPFQRAGTARTQAKLVLRWFCDASRVAALDLHEPLAQGNADGLSYLTLDGTLIPTDRVVERTEAGNDAWYSGKHKRFGGNIQVIADPSGFPLWTSPVKPGPTHDITTTRAHCLGVFHPAAATGLPLLAGKGCQGTGIGVRIPDQGIQPGSGQSRLQRFANKDARPRERANAPLTQRWTALPHIALSPSRIGAIVAAALVLTTLERGTQ
ncbi:transposase family protein [Kocuria marina]|uniref:transposase family protein n=1 Tax=Kocuria marina TaxID=223184 RepID=UPI003AFA33B1